MPDLPRLPKKQRNRKDKHQQSKHYDNAWRKVSAMYRKANPVCPVCKVLGKLTDITPGGRKGSTDHIIRLNNHGSKCDDRNLLALCNYHHDLKSNMESAGKMDWLVGERNESGYLVATKEEREQVVNMLSLASR